MRFWIITMLLVLFGLSTLKLQMNDPHAHYVRCPPRWAHSALRAAGRALMDYTGRNAVVLGLGLTGYSLARYLAARGANVRVADTRPAPPFAANARVGAAGVQVASGPFTAATFAGADLIAISPGVAKDQPAIAAAVANGAELAGDIELFARALPPEQKVLAITGSNGKSTVTALTGALCRAGGTRDGRRRQHRRRCARRVARRRELAGRLRARAVELPARNDVLARGDGRRGAQRHRQPSRPVRRHRRLRGRQGAHLSRAAASRC